MKTVRAVDGRDLQYTCISCMYLPNYNVTYVLQEYIVLAIRISHKTAHTRD